MRTKQIEESKTMIIDAFFLLIEDKEYTTITISDIAKSAGVSRMTFYRYFENKSAIIRHYIHHIIEKLGHTLEQKARVTFADLLFERNKLIYHDEKLRMAFRHEVIEDIFREVITQSKDYFRQILPASQQVTLNEELFVLGGVANITREWVKSGMTTSPESITQEILMVLQRFQRMEN